MHPYIAEIHHDCTLNNYYLQDNIIIVNIKQNVLEGSYDIIYTKHSAACYSFLLHFRFTLPSHFIDPDQAYSSLTHSGTPLQDTRRSQRRHQNNYEEGAVLETSTFNPQGNVLPTLGRTFSDRRQHRIQSPYAEVGEPTVGNGKMAHDEFYEKVYDDGYHFDVEEVYDKAQELPVEYETMEKVLAENPLYEKVQVSDF